jgi:predicted NAD/FAD-dependent oxidoreductase
VLSLTPVVSHERRPDETVYFDDEFWKNRSFERFIATDEQIRENQRLNRLQREKEERAYQNDNSTSTNEQGSQDKDKG